MHTWEGVGSAQWCGTNPSGPDAASNQDAHTEKKVKPAQKCSLSPQAPAISQTKAKTAITHGKTPIHSGLLLQPFGFQPTSKRLVMDIEHRRNAGMHLDLVLAPPTSALPPIKVVAASTPYSLQL